MKKIKITVWILIAVFILQSFIGLIDFRDIKAANDPSLAGARDTSTSVSPSISGQVNLSSGTFSTAIPIEIPPGRNGLQPAIALSYSSSAQMGVAGVGWDIPASSILRLGKNRGTPKYDSTDEFYLNLNGTSTKLVPYGDGTYRTRIETWSNIIPYPNAALPSYWIVKSKSGETYIFGSSSTPGSYAYLTTLNGQTILNSWMLSKVTDIDGNYIEYAYTPPSGSCTSPAGSCFNALLPLSINYGAGPGVNHFAKVVFNYSDINPDNGDYMDVKTSYFLGMGTPVKQGKRLNHIYIRSASDVILRDYKLDYTKSNFTGRSILSTVSITYYKPDGSSYTPPPYTFRYSDWAGGINLNPDIPDTSWPIVWEDTPGAVPGLPFVSDEYKSGQKDYPYQYGSVLLDINGDGLPDKIDRLETRNPNNSVSKIYLQKRDSSGGIYWQEVSSPSIPGKPFAYIDYANSLENLDAGVRFGDVNGDGLPDKIDYWLCPSDGPFPNTNATMYIYLADPTLPGWKKDAITFSQMDYDYNFGVKGLPFSAFWKDSAGKWHTLQKGTFLVDVNGDGYVDKVDSERLADKDNGTTVYQTRLGTGNGFSDPDNNWKPPTNNDYFVQLVDYSKDNQTIQYPVDRGYRFCDLNGDGLPDIIRYCNNSGNAVVKVFMNKGVGWSGEYPHPSTNLFGKAFTEVKLNSDGVLQSNDRGSMLFDMNGDGLPDKVDRFINCFIKAYDPFDPDTNCDSSNTFNDIHFNVGGFASETSGSNTYSNLFFSLYDTYFPWVQTGISEPLPHKTVFSQKFYYDVSDDSSDGKPLQEATRDLGVRVADINMDGIPDFIKSYKRVNCNPGCSEVGTSNHLILSKMSKGTSYSNAGSERRDILVYIENPLGGTTAVTYDSADNFYNTPSDSPISSPIVPWVVKSITVSNNEGDDITTTYRYFGPTFDKQERQFVGFKRVIATKPDGQSEETYFYTDYPLSGMIKTQNWYEVGVDPIIGNQPYLTTSTNYQNLTPDSRGIYHPHKTSETKTEWEGGRQITTQVTYSSYDSYDNPTEIITEGNLAISGDEKKVTTEYINDESHWLIGFAYSSTTYSKNSSGSYEAVSKKRFYYDGNTTYPPTTTNFSKGKVTAEDNWLKSDIPLTDTWIRTVETSYNSDGTVITVKQKGAGSGSADLTTTFSYDSTNRFPLSIIKDYNDGQGWSVSKTYDLWGNVLTTTDIKGNSTSTTYDALNRPTSKSIRPSGYPSSSYITTTQYDYSQAFSSRYIIVSGRGGGPTSASCVSPSSMISSTTYYDGLGRVTKTESKGWNGATVVVDTQYEAGKGRVQQVSRPHFSGSSAYWLTKSYDSRGRISQETGYGKTKVYSYGITSDGYYSATVSVSGHNKTTYTDVYGRIVYASSDVSEPLYYFYDIMGSLTKVSKDSSGNNPLVVLTYDTWGRKTSYYDSDSGVKTEYYYDLAGRLTQQDEISVSIGVPLRTTFSYNGYQGQLDTKQYSSGLQTTYTYHGSGQGLDSGEVNTIQDTFSGISATKVASRTYHREMQGDGTILTKTVYSVPWKESSGSNRLSLTFNTYTDLQGNLVKSQFPNVTDAPGETVQVSYQSSSGLLEKVTDANCTPYAQYTNYDAEFLTGMRRGANLLTNYTHDATTGHLTNVSTTYGGVTKQYLTYGYTTDDLVNYVSDSGPSNYDLDFGYDSQMKLTCYSSPSGYKNYNYDYDNNLTTSDDRTLGYGNERHQVMSDSVGFIYLYDNWGRLGTAKRNGGEETKGYVYDEWGRLITFNEKRKQDSASKRKGFYEYFGDGTRFKKVTFDDSGNAYEHLTVNGYEVEQLKNNMVRYRYPISGPTGVIAYKEQITSATFFANAVNRQSEYAIAGMKFDQFCNQILSRPGKNPIVFVGSVISAGKNLFSGISHGVKGFSLDPKNQEKIVLLLIFLFSGCFVIILFNGYPRRKLEKMLVGGTKQRRLKTCAYLRLPFLSGGVLALDKGRVREGFPKVKFPKPQPLNANFDQSSTSPKGLLFFNSTLLKTTARILILAMVFQGGLVFAPLTLNAQEVPELASPCSVTYYPLFDHLGTATILLDGSGNVVYEQHYAPFGQKDESHTSNKPSSCNNGENKDPFPYGFTGHFGDDESGLIYMGARYYNPTIGHFLTPDNVLPSPTDSLSYDRYAYTRNNPINLTDPTGNFFWAPIIGAVVGGIIAGMSDENIVLGMATGAASGALFGAASGNLLGTIGAGFASGAMNSAVYGGDVLRGAIVGAVTAGIGYGMAQMGSTISPDLGKIGMGAVSAISGGVVGGLGSVAMGGSFGEGFKVGFISAGLSYAANEIAGMIEQNMAEKSAFERYWRGEAKTPFSTRYGYSNAVMAPSWGGKHWPEVSLDSEYKSYLESLYMQEQAEVATLRVVSACNPNEWVIFWKTDDCINACTNAMTILRTMAEKSFANANWVVTHLLHVHPPVTFQVTLSGRTYLNPHTGKIEEAYTGRSYSFASGASGNDILFYRQTLSRFGAYNIYPSLGVIDSARNYLEYKP